MRTATDPLLRYLRGLNPWPASQDTDAVLLARFVATRDEDAFATLVARHGPMVLGVCQRVLREGHAAEDAFQATFLVLARKAPTLRRTSLAAWLHGVARHVAQKALRAETRRRRREQRAPSRLSHSVSHPLDELSARELLLLLDEELARLPEVYRQPILLCCLQGYTQEEAAQQLGWTAGSVKGRLERGRQRLRTRLQRRGIGLSAVLGAVEVARSVGEEALPRAGTARLIQAGLRFATHRGTPEGALSPAVSLAESVLKGMVWKKGVALAGLLLAVFTLASAGVLARQMLAGIGTPVSSAKPTAMQPEPTTRVDLQGDALPPRVIARLGTLRFRGSRGCLAFSPDGKLLASTTGSAGERVTLWDLQGREVLRIPGKVTLSRILFSPDGKFLACCSNSSPCRIIEVATGKERFTVHGVHAQFLKRGNLVTADRYLTPAKVRVWDGKTGRRLREWSHPRQIEQLAVAGQTVALIDGANSNQVRFHNLRTGAHLHSISLPVGRNYLALSSDGKTLAVGNHTQVRLWDVRTRKVVHTWAYRADSPPVFSPDNKSLAWTGFGKGAGTATVWIVQRNGTPRVVGKPVNNFVPPCFSPDGKALAVVTDAQVVQIRELTTDNQGKVLGHDSPVIHLGLSANGQHVVSRSRTGIYAWDTYTGKLLRRDLKLFSTERVSTLLPSGQLLTEDRKNRLFRVRDGRNARVVFRFEGRADVRAPSVSPGGSHVALSGLKGEVCVADLASGRWRYRFDPQGGVFGLRLSTDGKVCVWYRRSARGVEVYVRRHPGETRVVCTLPNSAQLKRWLTNLKYNSPDGRWLIVPGKKNQLRRWDLSIGKELAPLVGTQRTAWKLTWSPDGQLLLVSGSATEAHVVDPEAPREVRGWNVVSGKRLPHLDLPRLPGYICFSPDQRTVLTTDWQGVITLREVATGKVRDQLKGHLPGEVSALAMSADGRLLVSGGYDSQVMVWDLTMRAPDGRWRETRQQTAEIRAAWSALGNTDARLAYMALWKLVSDPSKTVTFLKSHLRPIPPREPARLKQLIRDLGADAFVQRQKAHRALEALGEAATTPLQQALTRNVSPEARRRLLVLLKKLERVPTGKQLQALRSVEVLEHINTSQAHTLLKTLANGAAGTRLTREAQDALKRLGK